MKIRIVLAICLFPLLVTAQLFPHHLKEDKLLGKVKTITIITNDDTREMYMYNLKGNQTERWFFKPIGVLDHRYKAVYNEKEQLLEETKFDKGITPVTKYVYGYDNKELLIGRSLFSENNTLLEKYIFKYDAAGRKTDSIKLDQYDNIVQHDSREFNSKGEKIRSKWISASSNISCDWDYKYSTDGHLVCEKRTCQPKDPFDFETINSYDAAGNLIAEKEIRVDGMIVYDSRYEYDSAGNKTSALFTDSVGMIKEKYIYAYDKKGRVIIENWLDKKGSIYWRYLYAYDDNGNQVEISRYTPPEVLDVKLSWQYDYDKTGNWIKKTQFINGVPGETIKREIEYY